MSEALKKTLGDIRHLRGNRVFFQRDGSAVDETTLRSWMERAQKQAGLAINKGQIHVLRHTCCSHLAMKNVPPRVIQELAAHADLTTRCATCTCERDGVSTEIRKSSSTFTDLGDDTRKIVNLLEDRHPTGQAQFLTSRRKSARFGPVGGNRGATLRLVRAPAQTYTDHVAPDAEKLVSEALKLPAEERVELVDRLLKSLDDEEGDDLEDDDRERLHAAIGRSEEQFQAGQAVPARAVLDALRKKR